MLLLLRLSDIFVYQFLRFLFPRFVFFHNFLVSVSRCCLQSEIFRSFREHVTSNIIYVQWKIWFTALSFCLYFHVLSSFTVVFQNIFIVSKQCKKEKQGKSFSTIFLYFIFRIIFFRFHASFHGGHIILITALE